jgi:hypothetical protein
MGNSQGKPVEFDGEGEFGFMHAFAAIVSRSGRLADTKLR